MPFNPFSLEGKTILVTGASSGIGRAAAVHCSRMGAKIVLTGRNSQRLQETMTMLDGDGHLFFVADLTSEMEIDSMAGRMPALDGVVHCAGVGQRKPCKSITQEDISAVMSINFNAAVLLQSSLLTRKIINKSASIVFLSSRTADIPTVANSIYSASKAAIKSYARCLADELAPRGIRVNCICPAMVWTDFIVSAGVTEDELMLEEKKYPLKRYGRPEDIANLIIYLLSDASSWMTGSSLDITGGAIII